MAKTSAAQQADATSFSPPLQEGCLVRVRDDARGIAKLVRRHEDGTAELEWCSGVALRRPDRVREARLVRERVAEQTRCYITDPLETLWQMGRILDSAVARDGQRYEYDVA